MLSIIIPAYNAMNYLEKCLLSLNSLTIDHEILIINDGSTDKTEEIALKLSQQNVNIRYFYKENGGLSSARNYGLIQAKGEYVWFIDSDDTVNLKGFEKMYSKLILHNLDLIIFGTNIIYIDTNTNLEHLGFAYLGKVTNELVVRLLKTELYNYAWNKLYKMNTIKENNLNFNQQSVPSEDFEFNCNIMKQDINIMVVENCFYNYLRRSTESLVSRYHSNLEQSLNNKHQAFSRLLNVIGNNKEIEHEYNYIRIIELEDFVINMYRNKCPLSTEQKINKIRNYVLNKENYIDLKNVKSTYLFTKIFISLFKLNNPYLIHYSYKFFTYLKNNFSKVHLKLRGK